MKLTLEKLFQILRHPTQQAFSSNHRGSNPLSNFVGMYSHTLFFIIAFSLTAILKAEETSIVLATVEKVVPNTSDGLFGVDRSNPPIMKVTLRVVELLQGTRVNLPDTFTTFSSSEPVAFSRIKVLIPVPMLGAKGVFALYRENDGLWYDASIAATGTTVESVRLPILQGSAAFDKVVERLRDRRDHPEKYPPPKPPQQPTQPAVPATTPVPPVPPAVPAVPVIKAELQKPPVPVPPADAEPSSESSPVLVWGAVVIVVLAVCVVMMLRRQTSSP